MVAAMLLESTALEVVVSRFRPYTDTGYCDSHGLEGVQR
jgi:hypothetical protein